MPREMRGQLIGYGPDMAKRMTHAKELLATYEKEKGKIDWSKIKLQCATTIKFSCENAQVVQQLLKKINVNIGLEPMLFSQLRANEVSGNYWLSLLGAAIDFDDPLYCGWATWAGDMPWHTRCSHAAVGWGRDQACQTSAPGACSLVRKWVSQESARRHSGGTLPCHGMPGAAARRAWPGRCRRAGYAVMP